MKQGNKKKRREFILNEIKQKGHIFVNEICDEFGCSEVTARTDIRELGEDGLLIKTHGGAVQADKGEIVESREQKSGHENDIYSAKISTTFFAGRYYLNVEEKQRIVEKAYEYIEDNDTIMLDDSTTCCYLAQYISRHSEKRISIVTNSLFVTVVLSGLEHINVYILGGRIQANPPSAMDNFTVESCNNYHVAKFFTGINRIDLRMGLTSADASHADVKKAMIRSADEVYVLADHTKFASGSLFTVCPIKCVHHIITDRGLDGSIAQLALDCGISMDIV